MDHQFCGDISMIRHHLDRIATCMEAADRRARERAAAVDPSSLGAYALWQQEVALGDTTVGFADWLAWHDSDQKEAADA